MQAAKTDPPFVPVPRGGWPTRRAPRWGGGVGAGPRAPRVAADVAAVLANRGGPAEAADRAALQRALRELDAQRTVVYTALAPAIRSLSPASTPPRLYG